MSRQGKITLHGQPITLAALAALAGVSSPTMCERLGKMTPEEAVAMPRGGKPPPDLTGQVFGRLRVMSEAEGRQWRCVCSCPAATEVVKHGKDLRNGNVKSCGCLQGETVAAIRRARTEGIVGRTFGLLTVLRRTIKTEGKRGSKRDLFACSCACGNPKEVLVSAHRLASGTVKSCGCLVEKRSLRVFGETLNLSEAAVVAGLTKQALAHRLARGMTAEEAVVMPRQPPGRKRAR